ncbi:hypothetical protein C8Q80DRAFT_1267772 [Daedaleopsis nitida]|nr:hypothetical protein C8Q80DRAFT_1267772 [Daedaleopsis nitida]
MPLTIREVGIVPSVERFVSTNYLLRHIVVLGLLVILALSTSALAYLLTMHYGLPTQFSSSDPRVGFQADSGGRATMDIVSSCASTLSICIYSAVHFNVPRSHAHRLSFWPPWNSPMLRSREWWLELWAKVSFWLLGVFSPEMLVLHAFYEYVIAGRDVAWMHEHGYTGWTRKLAFAADMGALTTESGDPDGGVVVRSGFQLHELLLRDREPDALDCKALEQELDDHSKADTMVKLLATWQITYFFVGAIARSVKGLPIAPLETVTCAYVLCTLVYYGLWWSKPYNVNERVIVRIRALTPRRATQTRPPSGRPRSERSKSKSTARTCVQPFWIFCEKIALLFQEPEMSESDRLHGSERMWQTSPYMMHGSLLATAASILLGLAHLACWNVEFPNSNGQVLWRYCTLLIIILPVVVSFIIMGAAIILRGWVTDAMNKMALTLIVIYCVARLILLILLGHSFQSLPAGVYDTVSWLSFIPSIH